MQAFRNVAATACAIVLAASSFGAPAANPLLHRPAPQFVRTDLRQGRVDLAEYKGKVVLLNFWATWCAPCQVEFPRFAVWQRNYGAQGLQVIEVSMDDDPELVRAWMRRHASPFPVLMGDEELGRMYGGVLGVPITFLIGRDGKIAAEFRGEPRLKRMEATVRGLLEKH